MEKATQRSVDRPVRLEGALAAWREALGDGRVAEQGEVFEAAQWTTFATPQRIWAVLFPVCREEVQACIQIASRFEVPVYPISRGKNWGLGSKLPPCDAVLLDLSRMDRIVDFDEEMAYITVEPGVTFQQVYAFLQAQGSSLMLSVTGGSPYASVIGNCAERGDGVGPYGDRAEHTCDMEVVLPDGEVLYTGFSRYAEASQIAPLSRWVPGPGINEMFLQSSLGIITRMTVWLMPKPAYLHLAWATFRDGAHLAEATEIFRRLMLQGVLPRNAMTMWNLYKILARKQQFPFATQSAEEPFLLSSVPSEPWYACAPLYYPSREHARVDRRYLLEQLEDHVHDLMFFDQEEHPEIVQNSLFVGVPTEENIASTYWRKSQPPPAQMDPDRDRCGVLWTCHVVPLQSTAVSRFMEIAERIVLEHGLEPNLGLSCMSVRAMRVFVALMYDRDTEGHDQKAMRCHDAVFSALCAEGFLPYRLGLPSMSLMPTVTDQSAAFLHKIKSLLDPHHVLAPGRYTFR